MYSFSRKQRAEYFSICLMEYGHLQAIVLLCNKKLHAATQEWKLGTELLTGVS